VKGTGSILRTIGFVSLFLLPAACFGQVSINANNALDGASVGTAYSTNLFPAGGTPPYTFSVISGSLPAGLSLSSGGILSGTPTTAGLATFTAMVRDSGTASATKDFTLAVSAAPLTLSPAPGPLPAATAGQLYQQAFTASGGAGPGNYTYFLIPVTPLTNNLDLDQSAGLLYGTPTTPGTFSFSVVVVDTANRILTQQYSIPVQQAQALALSCGTLPTLTPGAAYSAQLGASGGLIPYKFFLGSQFIIPAGLSLTAGGRIQGVVSPFATFSPTVTVQVSDGAGSTASGTCTIPVNSSQTPAIVTLSPLPPAIANTAYSTTIFPNVSVGSATFSASGLPAGLTIDAFGTIGGLVTAAPGTYNFNVSIPSFNLTKSFTLVVAALPLTFTTGATLPAAYNPRFYATTFTASEATTGIVSLVSGTLPPGLKLSGTQLIGTALASGTYPFTLEMDAPDGRAATQAFTLQVLAGSIQYLSEGVPPVGVVGATYVTSVDASPIGGSPYLYSTLSALPGGTSLNGGGLLAGIPTAAYNASPTFAVNAGGGQSGSYTLPIVIRGQALTISTPSVPATVVNSPYSAQITAIGGSGGSYYFQLLNSTLPSGITLSTSGLLSGSTNSLGSYPFTVQVSDLDSNTATRKYVLVVVNALTIVAPTLPAGTVGVSYTSPAYSAVGGASPYIFSIASGSLPAGLTLNSSSGIISGTPTAAGTATFVVRVTDAVGLTATTSTQSLLINAAPPVPTPAILPTGVVGASYLAQVAATGGVQPLTWTVFGSSLLPPGLTLSTAGAITGIPTTAGTYNFVLRVTDSFQQSATQQYQIVVVSALTPTGSNLPTGIAGTAYPGATLTASGGTSPYSWTVTGGSLAPGLTLATNGTISGIPTTAGTFTFTARVADSGSQSATAQYQIVVFASLTPTALSLPNGTVGAAYPGATLTATGGTSPYSWTVTGGALPPGLTLATNGAIGGTPTTAGTFSFRARVSDNGVQPYNQTATGSYQIVVNVPPVQILTVGLPSATSNSPYPGATFTATGGVPPYTWSVASGNLPLGLTLSAAGVLSGLPTSTGNANFAVKATDSVGNSATASFLIPVAAGAPQNNLTISPAAIPAGTVGLAYAPVQFTASATGPFSFSASGQVPPGLTLSGSGLLSGTPSQSGVFTFVVTGTGTAGTGFVTLTVRIAAGTITVSPGSLPSISLGAPVQAQFSATGGTPPYTFSGCSGNGFSLSASGLLSGTPASAGAFACTVTATDSQGFTGSVSLTLTVTAPLTIGPFTLPPGIVTKPYDPVTLPATGGKSPYTWSVISGSLPAGLGLSTSGLISGTPQAGGTFTVTVQVADSAGATASANGTLIVASAPVPSGAVGAGMVGVAYPAVTFSVSGGTKPFVWSSGGSLPPGLSLSADGVLSGTPTQAGSFNFTVTVTDSNNLSGTSPFTIRVAPPVLTIGTPGALPPATVGASYSQTFTAVGGTLPFSWTVSAGRLPNGVTLSPAGVLSGSPTENGDFPFTLQVSDAQQPPAIALQAFDLTVGLPAFPGLKLSLPTTIDPAQQVTFSIVLAGTFPLSVTGTLTVTADDPSVKFANGSTSIVFTVPGGQTAAVFASPAILMSSGTVGTAIQFSITLKASGSGGAVDLPSPPGFSTSVNTGPPVITAATASTASGTLTFTIQGFATTRQITQAKFHFTPAAGTQQTTSDFTVDVSSAFTQWYQSAASKAVGSMFSYTQPFTVQGTLNGSATVTLVNDKGSSSTVTVQFP
jgi:hypothetical protein